MVAAILFFQICGNNIVYIKDNQPYAVCHTVKRKCYALSLLELGLIRETSQCGPIKKFDLK